MRHCQAADRPMPVEPATHESCHSNQQKPAVFLLAIRPNKHVPRKRTEVKRIARNEQLGLTSVRLRGTLILA